MSFDANFQQTKFTYMLDFVFYAALIPGMWVSFFFIPGYSVLTLIGITLIGFLVWEVMEYFIHRYLFHGAGLFRRLHMLHHHAPSALIATPIWLSILILLGSGSLPVYLLTDWQVTVAFSSGLFLGYLLYGLFHYWMHNPSTNWRWLRPLRAWHALHHHDDKYGHFGVTSPVFDYVFGTAKIRSLR